jgi:lysophospholipase L1-like esterase
MIRLLSIVLFTCLACSSSYRLNPAEANIQYISYITGINVDGDPSDWPDACTPVRLISDIRGNAPDPSDLTARFRLGWNTEGLYIMAEVEDDSIYEDPEKFWKGDGMELFLSPQPGSFDIVQLSLRPSFDMKDSLLDLKIFDHRRTDSLKYRVPEPVFYGSKCSGKYILEGFIPLGMLGMEEIHAGTGMGIQLYINDSDRKDDTSNFSLPWYPVRESYRNPYAFHKIGFGESPAQLMPVELRAYIWNDRSLRLRVLSDKPYKNRQLALQAGTHSRRFNLPESDNDLISQDYSIPVRKISADQDRLQLFCGDSLIFEIETILLHRFYDSIPEPERFEKEIRIFEIINYFKPIPPNSTLITGSSTIRRWKNTDQLLPGQDLVNLGFGGSTMKDLNYYAGRIILPYDPARIIIYQGDNDIARGASPTQFLEDCREFIGLCQEHIPDAEIYFISIKPSPARMRNWDDMLSANRLLEQLSAQYEKVHYIDISPGILNESGEPREELFEKDRLHLNDSGYEIITGILQHELNE